MNLKTIVCDIAMYHLDLEEEYSIILHVSKICNILYHLYLLQSINTKHTED